MRPLTKYFLLILLTTNSVVCFSQIDTTRRFMFILDYYNIGVSYDKEGFSGEIGTWKVNELFGKDQKYNYDEDNGIGFSLGFHGLTLGSEFRYKNETLYVAPKIGYRACFLLVTSEINLIYYTDFKNGNLYLNPNIGIYLYVFTWTEMHLLYGYKFPITNNSNIDFKGHQVKLIWNLLLYNRKYRQTRITL